jgi:hypothetical protein
MKVKIILLLGLLAAGCAAAPQPLYDAKASSAGSASFARGVVDKQAVSFHDGLKGIILFSAGRRPDMSFKGCLNHAVKSGMAQDDWGVKYNEKSPFTRGMLAYMLVKVLGIQGGLVMQVAGPSQRYALRECQKLGLIKKGSPGSSVSGREFLSILRKAEEYAKNNIGRG